jgi:DNA repair exonuclease SbcCD ATPase subunit
MQFNKLAIQNFLAVGKAEINLANRGLLLVQGDNLDDSSQNSNGAGKSSIADALCWAFYGNTARGESGDPVVNDKAGKDCRVSVDVEDNGKFYTVTRHRKFTKKKNVLELTCDGVDMTKGTDKLTQEAVVQVLGCSYDVFRASVYAGQEDQVDLPAMTDKFLKYIVEEAAGVDKLQKGHEVAKEREKEAKEMFTVESNKGFAAQMMVDSLGISVEASKDREVEWQENNETEINHERLKFANVKKKVAKLVAEIKAHDKVGLEAELRTLVSGDEEGSQRKKIEELNNVVIKASNGMTSAKTQAASATVTAKKYKAQLDDVKSLIGTDCNECGKPLSEHDMDDKSKSLRTNIDSSVVIAKKHKAEFEAFEKSHTAAVTAKNDYIATLDDNTEKKQRIETLTASLDALATLISNAKVLKEQAIQAHGQIEAKTAAKNPHEATTCDLNKQLTDQEAIEVKSTEDCKGLQVKVDICKGVVEVFGNSGVRAHILDSVTPYLNDRTADYLGHLSDGNISAQWNTLNTTTKGELRENFHIAATSSTGGKSYRQMSGGEKRKVRLATNMALQDLVSSRATKPINLYIGDEIDDALDNSGLERLMGVLEERSKKRGTVLVISHNELSDWIRESITVVKSGGYSTIEV